MIEAEISCSTCEFKNHCMERSREYPCIETADKGAGKETGWST